jgi:hypothetical protein
LVEKVIIQVRTLTPLSALSALFPQRANKFPETAEQKKKTSKIKQNKGKVNWITLSTSQLHIYLHTQNRKAFETGKQAKRPECREKGNKATQPAIPIRGQSQ